MRSLLVLGVVAASCGVANADVFTEGFENVSSLFTTGGWTQINRSDPIGPGTYLQGGSALAPAPHGPANSFAVVNFASTGSPDGTSGIGTISNWLITPVFTWDQIDEISFFTRSGGLFADRLELRFSPNGASTNVGSTATSVGDFTTLLVSVNPTLATTGYPTTWSQFSVIPHQLPVGTTGRFAFRYFVTNGGPDGGNSNIIGLDTLTITPEPALGSLLAIGALSLCRRRSLAR